jgi:DNA polymerase III epsilon subunit-like protein
MMSFDTETTDREPTVARLVTASICWVGGGDQVVEKSWLANSDVPIPEETTRIHGITTAMAQCGQDALEVVAELVDQIAHSWSLGMPLVIFNAPYDLTLLKCECERHGVPWFKALGPVVDPLVIDRHYDRYRKGKRNLLALCEHYKAQNEHAHAAKDDALAAARVAWRQGRGIKHLGKHSLDELQGLQAGWFKEQGESLQKVFDTKGAGRVVPLEWPVRPGRAA